MIPVHSFLVKPKDGRSYDNETKLSSGGTFVISSSNEDHKSTQRYAEVVGVPTDYTGDVCVGDIIIVHHNTFRILSDIHGNEKNSLSFVRDGFYFVDPQQVYLRKPVDGDWQAISPYVFVAPMSSDAGGLIHQVGTVVYSATLDPGTRVSFEPECEYEFVIDGNLMYRMYERNVTAILG